MQKATARSLNAIVVEDNPIVLYMVTEMMRRLGHCISTAGDGAEALVKFIQKPCELVIADFEIPGISGYQLGLKIKHRFPETKVIIMTGFSRESVAGLIAADTIDAWLFKPFKLDALKTVINKVVFLSAD